MNNIWVLGEGPKPCDLMIIGEAPAKEEMEQGRPFVGKTGMEVNKLIRDIWHLSRGDVYVTNWCKRMLEDDKKMEEGENEIWDSMIWDEIEEVMPNVIVTMGAIATEGLLKLGRDMEAVNGVPHKIELRENEIWVVPCIHPAAAFREYSMMQWVKEAMEEAIYINRRGNLREWDDFPTEIVEWESVMREGIREIAVDTESRIDENGNWIPYMVQISSAPGMAAYAMVETPGGQDKIARLSLWANEHPEVTFLMHKTQHDIPILESLGIRVVKFVDTMVMAFLLQTLPLGLKNLAYRLCKFEMKEYEEVVGEHRDLSELTREEAVDYAIKDPDATIRVYQIMSQYIKEMGLEEVLERDMGIIRMVMAMMERGIKVNIEFLKKLDEEMDIKNMMLLWDMIEKWPIVQEVAKTKTTKKLGTVRVEDFNPGSDKQVAELLYQKMGLGKGMRLKQTRWGGSVDKGSLKKISDRHPLVKCIEEWRETDTLLDKFVRVLPEKVKEDGRIHTNISLIRVKHSGRLASSDPNLMAQPTRTEDGKRIREAFEAETGYVLVSFDYNQIEMRLMAHLSGDRTMIDAYRRNADIHSETAMRMWKIERIEDVDEMKHRYPAKRVGFGIINLITAMGLARELNEGGAGQWEEGECQEMLNSWFGIYGGVKQFILKTVAEARRYGMVKDMWGRMEYVPEFKSYFPHIKEEGERKAVNQQIQSGAQGIIKEAMRRLWESAEGWKRKEWAFPLIQIHDDLLWEVREDKVPVIVKAIRHVMENAVKISIPTPVEPKVGKLWGKMKKYVTE